MKRRQILLLIMAGIFIAALVAIVVWPHEKGPPEPKYRGKKLSEWLTIYCPNSKVFSDYRSRGHERVVAANRMYEAGEAVRQIGTNALPVLMSWISQDREEWRSILVRLPRPFNRLAWGGYSETRQCLALQGIGILGLAARPARPELTKLLCAKPVRSVQGMAEATALIYIGDAEERFAPEVLTNQVSEIHQ